MILRENPQKEPQAVLLTAGQSVGGSLSREFFERRGGWLHEYSCFYKSQRAFDKFYEKNADTLAVRLW